MNEFRVINLVLRTAAFLGRFLDEDFAHLTRYIYSTLPIMKREEKVTYNGKYSSADLALFYVNVLAAQKPDAEINL